MKEDVGDVSRRRKIVRRKIVIVYTLLRIFYWKVGSRMLKEVLSMLLSSLVFGVVSYSLEQVSIVLSI